MVLVVLMWCQPFLGKAIVHTIPDSGRSAKQLTRHLNILPLSATSTPRH